MDFSHKYISKINIAIIKKYVECVVKQLLLLSLLLLFIHRLYSLEKSCDDLPCSLILLQNSRIIGHSRVLEVHGIESACLIESGNKMKRELWGTVI